MQKEMEARKPLSIELVFMGHLHADSVQSAGNSEINATKFLLSRISKPISNSQARAGEASASVVAQARPTGMNSGV